MPKLMTMPLPWKCAVPTPLLWVIGIGICNSKLTCSLFFGASSETGLKYHICRRSLCDAGTSDLQNWSTAVLNAVLSRAQLWTQFQKFKTWSRGEEEIEVGHLHFILRKMLLVMGFLTTWLLPGAALTISSHMASGPRPIVCPPETCGRSMPWRNRSGCPANLVPNYGRNQQDPTSVANSGLSQTTSQKYEHQLGSLILCHISLIGDGTIENDLKPLRNTSRTWRAMAAAEL